MSNQYTPIAVVGMGCRFPGRVKSADDFWKLLCEGRDAIGDIPEQRWSQDYFYSKNRSAPGTLVSAEGGFIDDIAGFDHRFFDMPAAEAANMDPQQRLLLQTSWEAMEHGGISATHWAGESVGVFMGCFTMDYHLMQFLDPVAVNAFTATGIMNNMIANRISHAFDFRGPSMSIDTACSASLTAVHQAVLSIQSGESDWALAGGSMLMLVPDYHIAESRSGFLSADARCKAFSSKANGYVRSEGVGVVALKRLDDAIHNNDEIHSVIVGSAINQDGRTAGITAPSSDAQVAVMRRACAVAGIAPEQVSYVEAHGTGTPVGDPVEAQSIGEVYGTHRRSPLWIGSCKGNIGHTESAAGIAGLIKATLCVKHAAVPPQLHAYPPSPAINFEALKLAVPNQLENLPATGETIIAGVNSFGFGGANAHLLLRACTSVEQPAHSDDRETSRAVHVLPLSAQSTVALTELAGLHSSAIDDAEGLASWCSSVANRRAHLGCRKSFVATSLSTLKKDLTSFSLTTDTERPRIGQSSSLVWVFPGVGNLFCGMSKTPYQNEKVFRESYDRCDQLYAEICGFSVASYLAERAADESIDKAAISHPANFFHQISLANLWRSWGVRPSAIVGHSAGEFAAMCAAGVYELELCLHAIHQRVQVLNTSQGSGGVIAIRSAGNAGDLLKRFNGNIKIAAVNGPNDLAVSGDTDSLADLSAMLNREGLEHSFMAEPVPYHHRALLLDACDESELHINDTGRVPQDVTVYSTVTGRELEEGPGFDYWARNLVQPVQFESTIQRVLRSGHCSFLEVSSHATLTHYMRDCADESEAKILNPVYSDCDEKMLMKSIASVYEAGFSLDWQSIYPSRKNEKLPAYPWQNQSAWQETAASKLRRLRPIDGFQLLGTKVSDIPAMWECRFSTAKHPWLLDHSIMGACVLPGATYISMAGAAIKASFPDQNFVIEDIQFQTAYKVSRDNDFVSQLELLPEDNLFRVRIGEITGGTSRPQMAQGSYRFVPPGGMKSIDIDAVRGRLGAAKNGDRVYHGFAQRKYRYGACFQGICAAWVGENESLCELGIDNSLCQTPDTIHPIVLDLSFQSILTLTDRFELPVRIEAVRLFGAATATMYAHAEIVSETEAGSSADVSLYDVSGTLIATITGFQTRSLKAKKLPVASGALMKNFATTPNWELVKLAEWKKDELPPDVIVVGDPSGVAGGIEQCLKKFGVSTTLWQYEGKDSSEHRRKNLKLQLSNTDPDSCIVNCLADDADAMIACSWLMDFAHVLRPTDFRGKLWIVTRAAQQVAAHKLALNVNQAAVWGMGRAFGQQEFPRNWGGLIDLSSSDDCLLAARLILGSAADEDQISIRDDKSFGLRLHKAEHENAVTAPRFSSHGTYLVTGAFGALGREVVRWLVGCGARRIALTTSRAVVDREEWEACPDYHWLLELERHGVEFSVVQVDLVSRASLAVGLAQLPVRKILGVMHCAGLVCEGLLESLTMDSFQKSMQVKANSAVFLSEHLAEAPLEHFVLFSSIASTLPIRGMGGYAAANAVLDAVAHNRRYHGVPAISINWGPWTSGMVAEKNKGTMFKNLGMTPFDTDTGIAALGTVFHASATQVGLVDADWQRVMRFRQGASPMLEHMKTESGSESVLRVERQTTQEVGKTLLNLITELLGEEPQEIDTTLSLYANGFDSIAAMMLNATIWDTWSVRVSNEELLGEGSIDSLIEQIIHSHDSNVDKTPAQVEFA